MERRAFLKTGAALAATAGLGRWAPARAAQPGEMKWRAFEVVTRAEVANPTGPTRVWLPLPLQSDTDYMKSLGQTWTGNATAARVYRDEKYGAGILYAEWAAGESAPAIEVTTRFATRDRFVDVTRPGSNPAPEDRSTLSRYREGSKLVRTDGIVKKTSQQITKGVDGDVEKARAIYEWIVDNTFRDPKVRGCGVGDIRAMLETGNLGGKCADLNALFVGPGPRGGPAGPRRVRGTGGGLGGVQVASARAATSPRPSTAAPSSTRPATAGSRSTPPTCARWCWRSGAASRSTIRPPGRRGRSSSGSGR